MKHELKSFRASIKAYDAATGDVEAVVSVFNNVDLGGDRVMPGAFAKTLQEWGAKGDPIPVIWSHEWDDPTSHIGIVTAIEERPEGLWTKMSLDVEANPKAAYVARLLKQRRVTQFSFGYYTRDSKMVTDPDGTPVRELLDLELFEVGPTLLGMNPATQLLEAASRSARQLKAGRVLSSRNEESLAQAVELIASVLAQLEAEEPEDDVEDSPDDMSKSANIETKADAPDWMSTNARQGLDWYEEGLAGDGVVEATVREAREIAGGNVTDEKARKMNAWFARHMVDLDAPAADPDHEDYPSPGVVAHALWGGGTRQKSEQAYAWAQRRVEQLDAEKAAEPDTKNEEADQQTELRDTPDNINNVNPEIQYLLTRPKHTEENR